MDTDLSAAIWPVLNYRDAPAAIAFLTDVIGFAAAFVVHGEDEGRVQHAELRWPEGGGIMLGSASMRGNVFEQLPLGAASVYVVTAQPDMLYERAVAAGAKVERELRDEEHGSRGFTIRDPEGNLWSFGTYAGSRP